MDIQKIAINPASILSYKSACTDKINLPYSNDNLYFEAYNVFLNAAGNQDMDALEKAFGDSTVTTYFSLLPYRRKLLAGIKIVVRLSSGQQIEKTIAATLPSDQLCTIADDFFSAGALGLSKDIRKHLEQQYKDFCRTTIAVG